jgi:hypothetical protein
VSVLGRYITSPGRRSTHRQPPPTARVTLHTAPLHLFVGEAAAAEVRLRLPALVRVDESLLEPVGVLGGSALGPSADPVLVKGRDGVEVLAAGGAEVHSPFSEKSSGNLSLIRWYSASAYLVSAELGDARGLLLA